MCKIGSLCSEIFVRARNWGQIWGWGMKENRVQLEAFSLTILASVGLAISYISFHTDSAWGLFNIDF